MGIPLTFGSAGINGLKPLTATLTGMLLSERFTVPNGYAASNEAC